MKFFEKLVMYADDVSIFYIYTDEKVLQTQIEYDSVLLEDYARINKLVLNSLKTKFLRFRPHPTGDTMVVHINGVRIP